MKIYKIKVNGFFFYFMHLPFYTKSKNNKKYFAVFNEMPTKKTKPRIFYITAPEVFHRIIDSEIVGEGKWFDGDELILINNMGNITQVETIGIGSLKMKMYNYDEKIPKGYFLDGINHWNTLEFHLKT